MGCIKPSELWDEANKAQKMWINSKTIERWNFTDDKGAYKRVFESSTGKLFESGENITPKDMRKMQIGIADLVKNLKSPGVLSNKVISSMYVGRAISMRTPINKEFFDVLVNANEYRNRNNADMSSNYKKMISSLKIAMMDFQGVDTSKMAEGGMQARDLVNVSNMKNKKGQVGLETGKAVMLALLTLGVIAFALLIAMNSLNSTSVATTDTTNIFGNITGGVTSFFSNAGTWFSLLAVVVIILIVAIVIFAVNRFGGNRGL